ncbi:hypothetical protein [Dendronalium sp. ChiSLP03b]|uniref:hypothetical protein n=1 Tax=Dendronalium sp. ChiSLP03b TaxID=3075381 RepID=UPI002AD1DD9F|nr:hypothetical protein [Dendronalium sp. ChiSLP03b]MDZ8207692.1 hypothetical protein [Dendronalium sp. ChiSLP03b]
MLPKLQTSYIDAIQKCPGTLERTMDYWQQYFTGSSLTANNIIGFGILLATEFSW